jgi:glutathione peroxidase-type tryparedoxin peroxidase
MTTSQPSSVYDFTCTDADNRAFPLSQFRGRPMLITNIPSENGLNESGYEMPNMLYNKYKDRGLVVLAFPCNQFGVYEPGKEQDVVRFVRTHYNAEFPIMAKVDVNGENADPLWQWIKQNTGALGMDFIKWNFTSFLIDGNGKVVQRFAPNTSIENVEDVLVPLLQGRLSEGKGQRDISGQHVGQHTGVVQQDFSGQRVGEGLRDRPADVGTR